MSFSVEVKVRFGDVDHAGIVYYPRFFEYFHDAFEDMITSGGYVYRQILDERRVGFPTVNARVDFVAPLKFGDVLTLELTVARIGRSSASVRYRGRHGTKPAVDATVTVVCTDLDRFTSVPWPDDIRAFFTQHLEAS